MRFLPPSSNQPDVLHVADGATPSFLITMNGSGFQVATLDGYPIQLTNNQNGTYSYNFTPVHANHILQIQYILP